MQLKANRTCEVDDRVVWNKDNEEVEFVEDYLNDPELAFSGVSGHFDKHSTEGINYIKKTVSLNTVLLDHNIPQEIDYLSIDTEGSELLIIKEFPFEKWNIKLLTIEHNFVEPRRSEMRNLLLKKGFSLYEDSETKWDDWYINKTNIKAKAKKPRKIKKNNNLQEYSEMTKDNIGLINEYIIKSDREKNKKISELISHRNKLESENEKLSIQINQLKKNINELNNSLQKSSDSKESTDLMKNKEIKKLESDLTVIKSRNSNQINEIKRLNQLLNDMETNSNIENVELRIRQEYSEQLLTDQKQEIDRLKEEKISFETELKEKYHTEIKLDHEIKYLNEKLNISDGKIEERDQKLKWFEREYGKFKGRMKELESELSDKNIIISDLNIDLSNKSNIISKLSKLLNGYKENVIKHINYAVAEINQLNDKNKKLREVNIKLEKDNEILSKENETIKAANSDLNSRINSNKSRLKKITRNFERKILSLKYDISHRDALINHREHQVNWFRREFPKVNHSLKLKILQLEKYEVELSTKAEIISNCESRISKLAIDISSKNKEIHVLKSQASELRNKINYSNDEYKRSESDRTQLKNKLLELNKEIEAKKLDLSSSENEVKVLKNKITKLNSDLTHSNKQINEKLQVINNLNNKIGDMQEDIKLLQNSRDDKAAEINILRSSYTWKLGRTIVKPIASVRDLFIK